MGNLPSAAKEDTMRIRLLAENLASDMVWLAEWGFSAWIEFEGKPELSKNSTQRQGSTRPPPALSPGSAI